MIRWKLLACCAALAVGTAAPAVADPWNDDSGRSWRSRQAFEHFWGRDRSGDWDRGGHDRGDHRNWRGQQWRGQHWAGPQRERPDWGRRGWDRHDWSRHHRDDRDWR